MTYTDPTSPSQVNLEDRSKNKLPRLPIGQRVIVDGESIGRIVEYCYLIEYEDEPSNFSTLTEDDGVEPIDEDK